MLERPPRCPGKPVVRRRKECSARLASPPISKQVGMGYLWCSSRDRLAARRCSRSSPCLSALGTCGGSHRCAHGQFSRIRPRATKDLFALTSPTANTPTRRGMAAVIERETPHPIPGLAMILEVDFTVTNQDERLHACRLKGVSSSSLFFAPNGRQSDAEYLEVPRRRYSIEEQRRHDLLPSRVRSGEIVRGVYVGAFNWDPNGLLSAMFSKSPTVGKCMMSGPKDLKRSVAPSRDGGPVTPTTDTDRLGHCASCTGVRSTSPQTSDSAGHVG